MTGRRWTPQKGDAAELAEQASEVFFGGTSEKDTTKHGQTLYDLANVVGHITDYLMRREKEAAEAEPTSAIVARTMVARVAELEAENARLADLLEASRREAAQWCDRARKAGWREGSGEPETPDPYCLSESEKAAMAPWIAKVMGCRMPPSLPETGLLEWIYMMAELAYRSGADEAHIIPATPQDFDRAYRALEAGGHTRRARSTAHGLRFVYKLGHQGRAVVVLRSPKDQTGEGEA